MRADPRAKKPPARRLEPLQMVIVPTERDDADVIGLLPVPDRLPAIHRFPGESLAQMVHRALASATGRGPFLAYPHVKGNHHDQTRNLAAR